MKMKVSKLFILFFVAMLAIVTQNTQAKVVYTGEIGKKVIGYNGPTPLNITITGGKIANIEVMENEESPKYLKKAIKHIFPKYIGKSVSEALKLKVDAATGATYTSKALIENIKLGLQQSQTSKSKARATKKRRH